MMIRFRTEFVAVRVKKVLFIYFNLSFLVGIKLNFSYEQFCSTIIIVHESNRLYIILLKSIQCYDGFTGNFKTLKKYPTNNTY